MAGGACEQALGIGGRERTREQKSLPHRAAQIAQCLQLHRPFDPFCDHVDVQRLAELDRGADDGDAAALGNRFDQRPIELDDVEREPLELSSEE